MVWNYTTLKRATAGYRGWCSFTTLWNYTTLKLRFACVLRVFVLLPYEITLLSNDNLRDFDLVEFYYLMKLHYSQTVSCCCLPFFSFTTLWNYTTLKQCQVLCLRDRVLLPYEITLLSNGLWYCVWGGIVLLPYEITLLSNSMTLYTTSAMFYYLMKLHYSQTSNENKLRHYNSQGNIIKWLYYKPKIIFLQQFRTYLYPKYKDFLAEVSESCFDFQ